MESLPEESAIKVYHPERDSSVKYEVELSESGARKGMIIGGMIGSKVPHPLGTPVGVVVGGSLVQFGARLTKEIVGMVCPYFFLYRNLWEVVSLYLVGLFPLCSFSPLGN